MAGSNLCRLTVRRYLASGWLEPPRTLWFGCPVHNQYCCRALLQVRISGLSSVRFGPVLLCRQVHFARANNLADVAAKESSQETAVTLLGLVSGMVVAAYTDLTPTQSWCFFGALTMLHVVSNLR